MQQPDNHLGKTIPISVLYIDTGQDLKVKSFFEENIDIFIVDNHTSALSALNHKPLNSYDLIITAHMIPGIFGLELLQIVRKQWNHVPFILIAGDEYDNICPEAMRNGADYCIRSTDNLIFILDDIIREVNSVHSKIRESSIAIDSIKPGRQGRNESLIDERKNAERSIIWTLPAAFFRIDLEGHLILYSRPFAEQFGCSDGESLCGKNINDFFYVNPSDHTGLLDKLRKNRAIKDERIAVKGMNEGQIIVSISCQLLFDHLHDPVGIDGIIQDISHTIRVEEALIESERMYHLLENNIQEVVWTADMDMNLTYISPSVMGQRGLTQEEALLVSIQDSLTPESYAVIMKNRQEALERLQRGIPVPDNQIMDLEFLHRDGSIVYTEVLITPAFDRNGRIIGVFGVSRETRRKRCDHPRV